MIDKFCYKSGIFYYSFGDCAYIKDNNTIFNYASLQSCSQSFYNALLERGWRRFGEVFFAPFCDYCQKCVSIRYIVNDFIFSNSHKRVLKKNKNLKIVLDIPSFSIEKLDLYDKYHFFMQSKKGWIYNGISEDKYRSMFIDGHLDFGKEINYYLDDELIGVAFLDILEKFKSMSAIYFFYNHKYKHLSLGIFSILKQIEIARQLGLFYVYPGYWIKDHYSLGYKDKFTPFESLINRPQLYEQPIWQLYDEN